MVQAGFLQDRNRKQWPLHRFKSKWKLFFSITGIDLIKLVIEEHFLGQYTTIWEVIEI